MFTLSLFLCIVPAFLHASPRPLYVSPVCFQPGEGIETPFIPPFTSPELETSRNFLLLLLLLLLFLSRPLPLPSFFFRNNNNFYHLLVRTAASDTFFQSVSFLAGDERILRITLLDAICVVILDVGRDVNNT